MILELLWIAIAAGGVAVTITRSRFFEEFRALVDVIVDWSGNRWPLVKLSQLIHCPYCATHWLVALAWVLWPPSARNWVLMFFVTVTVATAVAAMMSRAYNFAAK